MEFNIFLKKLRFFKDRVFMLFGIFLCLVTALFSTPDCIDSFNTYFTKQNELIKKYGLIRKITSGKDRINIELDNQFKRCYIDQKGYFEEINEKLKEDVYIIFFTQTIYDHKALALRTENEILYSFDDIKYNFLNKAIFNLFLSIICYGFIVWAIVLLVRERKIKRGVKYFTK